MITREELMDWLHGCPCEEYFIAYEDEGIVRVVFCFEVEESEDD